MNSYDAPLDAVLHVSSAHKTAFKKAGIETVRDLLFFFPARYEDFSVRTSIKNLSAGVHTSIEGIIASITSKKAYPRRIPLVEIVVEDSSGKTRALWMNQPYIAKALVKGSIIHLSGTVKQNKKGELYMVNPVRNTSRAHTDEHTERIISYDDDTAEPLIPVYPPVRGVPARILPSYIQDILHLASELPDSIPASVRKTYNLPEIKNALFHIHKPSTMAWADAARKRFAFDEMFAIQLHRVRMRTNLSTQKSFTIPFSETPITDIETRIAFPLTGAQKRAGKHILKDFSLSHPMARLLEGDVGSGKTLVAIIAARAVTAAGGQTAYLAPTEILARQHLREFCKHPFSGRIGLITSSECRVFPSKARPTESVRISRAQLLVWVADGTVSVLIGTHALIQKDVLFKCLALLIVDEQHRFGIEQRNRLVRMQEKQPHLLSMTATPIPRTLALTLYGDLDISLLDEMPPGRKPPETHIIPPEKRESAYEFIRNTIKDGGQAFVIYPKIGLQSEEHTKPDKPISEISASMKAVVEEHKRLKEDIFPEFTVGMLHGKLKPREKEDVIAQFRAGDIHILVSTSVIEVGIDIPNASIMMIEGAERFGLATLHQFRGRVGRGGQKSYCFIFTDSKTPKTLERLQALTKAKNGFELAEYDLSFRGPGELSGSSQWGISDIGMEALRNIKMVEAARTEAEKLLLSDPKLAAHPILKERVEKLEKQSLHFE